MTKQYFHKLNHCLATFAEDKNCICWHDQGTGPLPDKCWSPDDTDSNWRDKPMTVNSTQKSYLAAIALTKLHSKLDVARNIINNALDETPSSFDKCQLDRIIDIREDLNREIGRIFELRKDEANGICRQIPDPKPEPIIMPAEEPDDAFSLPVLAVDTQIFPPDPVFMEVRSLF
jgi:hypothetical protein